MIRFVVALKRRRLQKNDVLTRPTPLVHPDVEILGKLRRLRDSNGTDIIRPTIESRREGRK